MGERKYFADKRSPVGTVVKIFLVLLLFFAVSFFLWSVMRYNELQEEKRQKQEYIAILNDNVDRLEYLVEAPLDDAYKIRVARERLGMCFPDETIYHTELD